MIQYTIRIVVPRNNGEKLRIVLQRYLPIGNRKVLLNPKSFHTFDLNEGGAGCNSTEEDIFMNELRVFAVGA